MPSKDPYDPRWVDLLVTLAREEERGDRTVLRAGPWTRYCLVTALQLAARHPDLTPYLTSTYRTIAGTIADTLPHDLQPLINAGWDPQHDVVTPPAHR